MITTLVWMLSVHASMMVQSPSAMAALDSEDFAEREAASVRLTQMPAWRLLAISAGPMTPEQRGRISEAYSSSCATLIPSDVYRWGVIVVCGEEDHDLRMAQAMGFLKRKVENDAVCERR